MVTAGIQCGGRRDPRRGRSRPTPFTFTLTGRSGDIELQLGNTSDDSLTVILRASSPKLSFPGSTEPTVGPPDADAGDHIVTLRPNDETAGHRPGARQVERHVADHGPAPHARR